MMNVSKTNRIIIRNEGWGDSVIENILAVLTSSISLFETNIEPRNFNNKLVLVQHSNFHEPKIKHPKIYKIEPNNLIYLHVEGTLWSKFAYQFAHEYCHHLIDSEFINTFDQFGWFEETLCELASILSIKNMSKVWEKTPPYTNWSDYSKSLNTYSEEIVYRESNLIEKPLSEWIRENLEELSTNRYLREKNCLVATNIMDLFESDPTLWNTIPFIKNVALSESMKFNKFIDEWGLKIENSNKDSWCKLKNRLLNNIHLI